MKKLMIAACAIAFAAVSQAAVLNWSTWGYTGDDPDAGLLNESAAYLVLVTDTANFAVADDLSVTGGSVVDATPFADGVIAGTWNDTAALVDGTKYYFAIIATTAGDDTSGLMPTTGKYGVDYNGDNATGSGFYEVTWNASTGGTLDCDWDNFGGVAANTAVGAEPVPEPTSGMLLILGVAGLALRRRRA